MSVQYARLAAIPRPGALNGVSRETASSVNTEQMASTSPRSQPLPKASISARTVSFMAAKYSRSGYEFSDVMSLPLSPEVHDAETNPGICGIARNLRAAARRPRAEARRERGERHDAHRTGDRRQLLHDHGLLRRRSQTVRRRVRQGRR